MTRQGPLLVEIDGAVATVTLNRPERRNAINNDLREQLIQTVAELEGKDAVKAMVLTGAGSAFCSGADVREGMRQRVEAEHPLSVADDWRRRRRVPRIGAVLYHADLVTIAAVNGPAVGLGFDIALSCDFIIAGRSASFSSIFVERGLIPDGGGMYHLPRRVGIPRAKEIMFSGRAVRGDEALALGLVEGLAEDDELLGRSHELAVAYAGKSRASLMLTKAVVNRTFEFTYEHVADLVDSFQAMCGATDDHRSAVRAFLPRTEGGA